MPNLPKPFKRPSASLSTHGREWRTVPVNELRVGDTVADFGRLEDIRALTGPSGLDLSAPLYIELVSPTKKKIIPVFQADLVAEKYPTFYAFVKVR